MADATDTFGEDEPVFRVTLHSVKAIVNKQNSLKRAVVPRNIRNRSKQGTKRKERHVRWYPETCYRLVREGIALEESPEKLYTQGELREQHMYHFSHYSEEAERNMKRPKHVGVFRVSAFERTAVPHYVRPQHKYLRQMYGFDKMHPLPEGEETRTDRTRAFEMVEDPVTGTVTPYHIDIFAIRSLRSQRNSQQRRIRKRRSGAIRASVMSTGKSTTNTRKA